MPVYRFTAVTAEGLRHRGTMEAADATSVARRLQSDGYIPVRAELANRFGSFADLFHRPLSTSSRSLSHDQIATVTRELATMLSAGEDMNRALSFIHETAANAKVKRVLAEVREKVRGGSPLATTLAAPPASFPRLYVGLVRAGESSGTLADTLERLAELMERERSLAMTVNSALVYPALLVAAAIGTIFLLISYVLPQFEPLFQQSGTKLPGPTQFLIDFGNFAATSGPWVLAGLGILVLLMRRALQNPRLRRPVDGMLLRLPILGGLMREISAARFCRTLGTLLANGTPLITALGVVKDTLSNLAVIEAVDRATESARSGDGLARPLAEAGVFPERTMHLLQLGEETAQLAPIALKAASIHEERTRIAVQRLVSLLVPAITIALGAAVAAIIGSLFLAMLSLNDLAH